jgi:ABC-type glycerol-3-phosphate transport system substrate-binding protein
MTRRSLFKGSLLASVAVAATALAGCSSPVAPPSQPSPPTAAPATQPTQAAPAATTPATGQSVTLSIVNVEFYSAEQDKTIFPVAYEIFRKQSNGQITVNETLLPEDKQLYVKILTMIAGGTPLDAAYVHPAAGLPQYAGTGTVIPLDDYVKTDSTVNFPDLYPGPLSYYQYPLGVKLYGLPFYSGPSITIFNKRIFQQAGEKTPDQYEKEGQWTWEKLLDVGQKLTKGQGATKTFGYQSITSNLHWLNILAWGYGSDLWDDSMDTTLIGQDPAAQALDFYASFQYKASIVPSAAEAEGLAGGFLAGRTGVQYGIKANIPEIAEAVKNGKMDVGITGIPKGPKGRFVRNGPNSYCIFKASRYHDEAWKLVNFMTQKEFQGLQNPVGGSMPIRKSLLESGDFKNSLQPWEDLNVYTEASQLDKPLRFATTHPDIQAAFGAEYDLVKLGKETYKDAAAKFVPKINDLLKKAKST